MLFTVRPRNPHGGVCVVVGVAPGGRRPARAAQRGSLGPRPDTCWPCWPCWPASHSHAAVLFAVVVDAPGMPSLRAARCRTLPHAAPSRLQAQDHGDHARPSAPRRPATLSRCRGSWYARPAAAHAAPVPGQGYQRCINNSARFSRAAALGLSARGIATPPRPVRVVDSAAMARPFGSAGRSPRAPPRPAVPRRGESDVRRPGRRAFHYLRIYPAGPASPEQPTARSPAQFLRCRGWVGRRSARLGSAGVPDPNPNVCAGQGAQARGPGRCWLLQRWGG